MRHLPFVLAGLVGCAGGGPAPSPTPPLRPPPSLATTPTDHQVAALTPAALTPGLDGLDRAIATHFEAAPTRRAYLQTDKPIYQPGETIWFRADLRATATFQPGPPVGVTVQLVSPRGSVVATRRVLAKDGVARNDLPLDGGLDGGEYKLTLIADDGTVEERAIIVDTYQAPRLQKSLELLREAYGAGDEVAAAIELKQATGEAFAGRPVTAIVTIDDVETNRFTITTNRAGQATARFRLPTTIARGDGLLTILADDGGVTESIQRRIPIVTTTLQLGLYPEGGDLVDGVPGRVYFQARTPLGKPADIEGKVIDDRGATVAEFRSVHDGLGRFELTPATDRRYTVHVTKPAGITSTFTVPAGKPGGCVLRAVDPTEPTLVRIAAVCNTTRELGVVAVLRERRLGSGRFTVEADQPTVVEIPVDPTTRGQGVVRVTLFSAQREPLAERLIYHAPGDDLRIELTPDRAGYTPRERVKLKIKTTDRAGKPVAANLALAAVDESVLALADDKSARIKAALYLEPELGATAADPIEEPNFYFGATPEAAAAMDALLATRGYRRFEWRPITAALGATP